MSVSHLYGFCHTGNISFYFNINEMRNQKILETGGPGYLLL